MTCRRPSLETQTSSRHGQSSSSYIFEMANHTFISPKGNLQNLIENIYEILGKSGISGLTDNELSRLKNAVFSAEIPEDEWRPFAVFRHEGYSRNLVDHGNGNFDLLLVAWNPGQSRYINRSTTIHFSPIILVAFMIMLDHTV